MNIVLSCIADKKKYRGAYVVYKGGRKVVSEVFSIADKGDDSTLKEYLFESLIRGLRNARSVVNHEDLLLIKLSNMHMVEWLNGSKEYKDYSKYLDEIVDIIDTLDCRYLFTKDAVRDAKRVLEEGRKELKVEGIDSVFEGMDE